MDITQPIEVKSPLRKMNKVRVTNDDVHVGHSVGMGAMHGSDTIEGVVGGKFAKKDHNGVKAGSGRHAKKA